MKKIMYMATTINGFIAREDDDTSWISKQEWDSYSVMVRNAGNVIIGHRTYNIITKQPEFAEFKDVKIIIISHHTFTTLSSNHVVVFSPHEALKMLEEFSDVIIAGGSILNSSFLKENLVDEIYVDIEPVAIGKGIPLFSTSDFETKLQLLETRKISENEIQLHYKVM